MRIQVEYGEKIKIGRTVRANKDWYIGDILPISLIEDERCEICGTELQGIDVHFLPLLKRQPVASAYHEENNIVWCPECKEGK